MNDLVIAYSRTHDAQIRSALIFQNLSLVESIAKRFKFKAQGEYLEDLIQVGTIGLIKAIDHYKPDKEAQFSTYATHQILGEIRHYLRDKANLIRHPRWLKFFTYQIYHETEMLAQKLGRFPSPLEIANSLNVDVEGILEVIKLNDFVSHSSYQEEGIEGVQTLRKKVKTQRMNSFQLPIEDKIVLFNALDKLIEIERKALYLFFYQDLTQTEIGKYLGLNQRAVSRLIEKALGKLKNLLTTDIF